MSIWTVIAPAVCVLLLLSLLAAPMGSIMLWRGQVFFAEAFAHASVLGLCVAVVMGWPYWLGGLLAVAMVLLAMRLLSSVLLPDGTLLMMIAASALALVALWISVNPILQKNLSGLLFGDILLVGWQDVAVCLVLVGVATLLLWCNRHSQIKIAINPKLAAAEGEQVDKQHWIFMLAIAAFTVFCVQSIGAMLTSSLLLIPSMAARLWALSPLGMIVGAWVVLLVAIGAGVALSVALDVPTGPCVVCVMTLLYVLSRTKSALFA